MSVAAVSLLTPRRDSSDMTSPSGWIGLGDSFKFFILTSKNFVEQSSVMKERVSQIFRGRFAAAVTRDDIAGNAIMIGVFRVGFGNIGHAIVQIVRCVTTSANDVGDKVVCLVHGT